MTPITFPERNRLLEKPKNMTEEECSSLPIFSDGEDCISCWQLSDRELAELLTSKRIWLIVKSGGTQPPVSLQIEYPFVVKKG